MLARTHSNQSDCKIFLAKPNQGKL
uniref:Uncharacterized protein n=1 Tax=Anguilla anguilla TaxID=7936 RepID=A0A0E9PNI3_ANGAN